MSAELNESENEMEIGDIVDGDILEDNDAEESNSEDDDTGDSDLDDEGPLIVKYIEILQAINENRYDYNNYALLIDLAHKLNDLDKIRESCNLFSSVFPLAPEFWLKWIIVELKLSSNPEEYENVQKLFRRALSDYYSTDIAIEYAKLAILWDNDEIWDEIVPKYAFNCLKGSQLFEERRNHFQIKLDDSPENIKRMIKIYQTECKLPLFEIEKVYLEFKAFSQKHETISAAEIDWETVDRRYNRATNILSKILPFELKLKNLEAKKYGEKERLYLEYIKECEDLLEDDFLQAIYERMVTDCCLSSNVWFEYMEFIDSLSNDSDDEDDDLKQSVFNYTKLDVIERALRNITWNSEFYVEKLRIIEKSKSFDKSTYKDTFEAAIAVGFETPEPLVQIWLEYLTHLRRQTDFQNEQNIEILRKNFDLAWNTLGRQWGVLADQQCEILQFWGHLEYTTMRNMLKGRELWNTVMESADNSNKTALWIKFIDFETSRNIESARKLYSKAIHVPNLDNYLSLQTAWLSFERVYGNTNTLKNCETICRKIYANLYSNVRTQKKDAVKPKQPTKPDISKKRLHSESTTGSKKSSDEIGNQAKKIKSVGENLTSAEIDETKEHLTVFLSNLDYKITESEISTLFPNFMINKILLPQDDNLNRGRGYGYVEFSDEIAVQKALDLDRSLLNGRPTYISPCNRDKNARDKGFKFSQDIEKQKLFVKGIPHDATQEDLEVLFKKFGELKSIRIVYHKNGKSKGIAYVEYKDEKSASKAVLEMDQKEYRDHVLIVAISAPPPRPSSSRFEVPFKRIIKSTAKDEMRPRLSFIPQAVQKRIIEEKRSVSMDVAVASPPEKKTNDYFRNLANMK